MSTVLAEQYEEVFTVEEVAAHFKLSPSSVRNLIRSGELSAIRLGRQYRIPKSVIDSYYTRLRRSHGILTPEEAGFGAWQNYKEIKSGVHYVNVLRGKERRGLRSYIADLESQGTE